MKRTLIVVLLLLAACRKAPPPAPQEQSVTVGPESVAVVAVGTLLAGPLISGTLQPQQSATLLAETGGTVTSVRANEGQRVSKGTVLATIDDEAAGSAHISARTGVQSAQTAVAMAQRDLERAQMLAGAGAVPKRDVDVARTQLSNARAQLAQAQSMLSTSGERLESQTVRASLTGTVSAKHVSAGDLVTPGAQLFTIVDLSTLQLEASVPSDALASLRIGSPVQFEVRGVTGALTGTITRIAPTVDPATGQVKIYVSIANERSTLVGGLFAEGSVSTVARTGLGVPLTAVDETGPSPTVTRLNNGVAERVAVKLGARNESRGVVEILSGLREGDRVLTGPARTITPGTRVTIGRVPSASPLGGGSD